MYSAQLNTPFVNIGIIRQARVLEKLGYEHTDLKEVRTYDVQDRSHSISGLLELVLADGTTHLTYCKQTKPEASAYSTEPSPILHEREASLLPELERATRFHTKEGSTPRVPRFHGRYTNLQTEEFFLFMEPFAYRVTSTGIRRKSFRKEEYQQIVALEQIALKEGQQSRVIEHRSHRINMLRRDVVDVAYFNGMLQRNFRRISQSIKDRLRTPAIAYEQKHQLRSSRLHRYLLQLHHYAHMGGKEYQLSNGSQGSRFEKGELARYEQDISQRFRFTLADRVETIMGMQKSIIHSPGEQVRLCNGDARTAHKCGVGKRARWIDLEDIGYWSLVQPLITYLADENTHQAAMQYDSLLALYMYAEHAAVRKGRLVRRDELRRVTRNGASAYRELRKIGISVESFNDALCELYFGTIVDNLIILDGDGDICGASHKHRGHGDTPELLF